MPQKRNILELYKSSRKNVIFWSSPIYLPIRNDIIIIFKLSTKIIFWWSLTSFLYIRTLVFIENIFISTWYRPQEKKTASFFYFVNDWIHLYLIKVSSWQLFLFPSCIVERGKSLIVILFKEKENVFRIEINQNSRRSLYCNPVTDICWSALLRCQETVQVPGTVCRENTDGIIQTISSSF